MSNEKVAADTPRPYRKDSRARKEAETRLRITEAVVELHEEVGPANTTVTEVAKRAGTSRMTVYNHFPTEAELIEACSTHWASQNPLPDPGSWVEITDPADRLRAALVELYAWYRKTEPMMGKVLRDASIVPALGDLMDERWFALVDQMVDVLAEGREAGAGRETRVVLRLVLDFTTWKTLTTDDGAAVALDDAEAACLATRMVESAPTM